MVSVVGTNTDIGGGCGKEKRIERALPEGVKVLLGRAVVVCRKLPRVQGRDDGQSLFISDGVLILESGCAYEGRELVGAYKLIGRWVQAQRIRVLPYKANGSRNHHKFVVSISNGVVS